MADLRDAILDAIKARLDLIKTIDGYDTDMANQGGAQLVRVSANPLAKLPVAIISLDSETKEERANSYYEVTATVELELIIEQTDETALEKELHKLISDVERALMPAVRFSPPLLVTGVQDMRLLGHRKTPVDGENMDGAIYRVEVIYRHALEDPRVAPS